MNVEMGFKVGVANHVVEREGFGADDVAEVRVNHVAIDAPLEPELDERHHGVGFAAIAGETADEVAAFFSVGAVTSNEAGYRCALECGNENFDIVGMFFLMFRGEIEKHGLERFWDLGLGKHGFHLIDSAETNFKFGILFGGREMAAGLAAPRFGEIGSKDGDGFEVIHGELSEASALGFEGIDDGGRGFDRGNPLVDMNEAGRRKCWNIEIARESTMPGDETILKVGDGVAVGVIEERHNRVSGDTFPAKRIVRRKTRQRTDVLYHSKAIEVLEPTQTHRTLSSPA